MTELPVEFVGLWSRVGLSVNGEELDPGTCRWFQGRTQFLDIRGGGGHLDPMAFCGATEWSAGAKELRWHHVLDMETTHGDDVGHVEWDGDDLLEHGVAEVAGGEHRYTERWRSLTEPGERVVIADRVVGLGRIAMAGSHGGVLISHDDQTFAACGLFGERESTWTFELVIGESFGGTTERLTPLVGSTEQCFGERWEVVDVGPQNQPDNGRGVR